MGWGWGGQRELSSTAKPELDIIVRFVSPQAGEKPVSFHVPFSRSILLDPLPEVFRR